MEEHNIHAVKLKRKEIVLNDLDVNIESQQIDDTVSLYDDGIGLDSIAIINFIVLVEERFNISFDENEISARVFSNIQSLGEFILTKITKDSQAVDQNILDN